MRILIRGPTFRGEQLLPSACVRFPSAAVPHLDAVSPLLEVLSLSRAIGGALSPPARYHVNEDSAKNTKGESLLISTMAGSPTLMWVNVSTSAFRAGWDVLEWLLPSLRRRSRSFLSLSRRSLSRSLSLSREVSRLREADRFLSSSLTSFPSSLTFAASSALPSLFFSPSLASSFLTSFPALGKTNHLLYCKNHQSDNILTFLT